MKMNAIHEYFYYFLCFVLLYRGEGINVDTFDSKNLFMNKMSELNTKNELYKVDEGFSELIYDMEGSISANEDVSVIIDANRDFIYKYSQSDKS